MHSRVRRKREKERGYRCSCSVEIQTTDSKLLQTSHLGQKSLVILNSLWNFVCVCVYKSAHTPQQPVMHFLKYVLFVKRLLFSKNVICFSRVEQEFESHAEWMECSGQRNHFLRSSEFSQVPYSSTSLLTTRSISATSRDSCSLRNVLREKWSVVKEREQLGEWERLVYKSAKYKQTLW